MALSATVYNFDVELADTDRGVYESLALRVARQPSETEEFLVARVLAYLLEYGEGIEFSRGLAEPDEPAIAVRDLTGEMKVWIDVGAPDAARLHKAQKAMKPGGRVAVYTHKDPARFLQQLAGEKIHRAEELELYAIDAALIDALVERLERRVAFSLTVTDRELYLSLGNSGANPGGSAEGGANLTGAVVRLQRQS